MSTEQMKQLLHRDKLFLKEVYESDSISKSKRILNFVNDNEMNTLCKYLHFLSNGEIKIKKTNFEAIGKKHIQVMKKSFESKKNFQKVNQISRKDKMKVLLKLIPVYNHILAPLFNQ